MQFSHCHCRNCRACWSSLDLKGWVLSVLRTALTLRQTSIFGSHSCEGYPGAVSRRVFQSTQGLLKGRPSILICENVDTRDRDSRRPKLFSQPPNSSPRTLVATMYGPSPGETQPRRQTALSCTISPSKVKPLQQSSGTFLLPLNHLAFVTYCVRQAWRFYAPRWIRVHEVHLLDHPGPHNTHGLRGYGLYRTDKAVTYLYLPEFVDMDINTASDPVELSTRLSELHSESRTPKGMLTM